jgi:prepilin-type processing-associated H-X9-DG protein
MYFCPSRRSNTVLVARRPSAEDCSQGCALNDYASATPGNYDDVRRAFTSIDHWYWQSISHISLSGTRLAEKENSMDYQGVITRTFFDKPCRMGQVSDGTSKTMAVSEKRLAINRYQIGDWHDDIGWTDGWDPDIIRFTGVAPAADAIPGAPSSTTRNLGYQFGSAHSAGINTVFADGHVTLISFNVDVETFNAIGHRDDGLAIDSDF